MTFLSLAPDTVFEDAAPQGEVAVAPRALRAPFLAHCLAMSIIALTLTIPGGVAHAKWTKLNLILNQVQHRCVASFTA